jgi:hypothetical protein
MMIFNVPGNIQDIGLILYSRIAEHLPHIQLSRAHYHFGEFSHITGLGLTVISK